MSEMPTAEHIAFLRALRQLDAEAEDTTIYRCALCGGDYRHEECPYALQIAIGRRPDGYFP